MKSFDHRNELTRLAFRMNQNILWPYDQRIDDLIEAKCRIGATPNVYRVGGYSTSFCVKIALLGKQYRVCISPLRFRACRFADVATLYFWKYRSTERQPEDSDFNTTRADAEMLLYIRPEVLINLRMLEEYFQSIGVIKSDFERAKEQTARDFVRELRIARKYIERSRRYVRNLRAFALGPDKLEAVAVAESALTSILDNQFSDTLQADAPLIVQTILNAEP